MIAHRNICTHSHANIVITIIYNYIYIYISRAGQSLLAGGSQSVVIIMLFYL